MSGPANLWRADGGYQTLLPRPVPMPGMYFYPPPPVYVQGPLPVHGLWFPPPNTPANFPAPPQQAAVDLPPPPPAPKKEETKKVEKNKLREDKKEDKTNKDKRNGQAKGYAGAPPPALRPGMNYMFPLEHTSIFIFNNARKIWMKKYEGQQQMFRQYQVDTAKTVKAIIEFVMHFQIKGDFEKCKGWVVTEVIEAGDATWKKGTSIEYASGKAKGTLASMGWTSKRGDTLPPVWITVHKA